VADTYFHYNGVGIYTSLQYLPIIATFHLAVTVELIKYRHTVNLHGIGDVVVLVVGVVVVFVVVVVVVVVVVIVVVVVSARTQCTNI